jgi:anthranilate synthase component 1
VNRDVFENLKAAGYNRIPVYRSVLADLDTPLSVYLKLASGADTYLLESVEGGETWGRFSFIGLPCQQRYSLSGTRLTTYRDGVAVHQDEVDDPLDYISSLQQEFNAPRLDELPVFTGGLVGYFGYEIVQRFEPRLIDENKPDELETPEMVMLLSEEVAVFDNLAGRLYLIVNVDPKLPGMKARVMESVLPGNPWRKKIFIMVSTAEISSTRCKNVRSTSFQATFSRSFCRNE